MASIFGGKTLVFLGEGIPGPAVKVGDEFVPGDVLGAQAEEAVFFLGGPAAAGAFGEVIVVLVLVLLVRA